MGILNSKWVEKIFLTASGLLLIWLILGFVFVGGFIFLLFIIEIQEMEVWTVIKERSAFLSFFIIMISLSVFTRSHLEKSF